MIIAFDLDGTLIDSARDLGDAVSELVQSYGAAPLALPDAVAMVGDGAPVLVRRALERAGLDPATAGALDRFMQIYGRRLLDHTAPYPGVRESLALCVHRGPLAVLTNKPLGPSIGTARGARPARVLLAHHRRRQRAWPQAGSRRPARADDARARRAAS